MSRFQAGALVVYGNLGVHEVEGVGLRRFCDEPAREYYTLRPYFSDSHDAAAYPHGKGAALRPVTPGRSRQQPTLHASKRRSCPSRRGYRQRWQNTIRRCCTPTIFTST